MTGQLKRLYGTEPYSHINKIFDLSTGIVYSGYDILNAAQKRKFTELEKVQIPTLMNKASEVDGMTFMSMLRIMK